MSLYHYYEEEEYDYDQPYPEKPRTRFLDVVALVSVTIILAAVVYNCGKELFWW